jgi:AraC-like DNA-binding protein
VRRQPSRSSLVGVRDYLVAHAAENVSLHALARFANLNPFHLNHAFTEQFGMPPHAFQVQVRVHQAKRLLRAGCSIAQTAMTCGFVDQSHLNRQFKRLIGISPGQFRNRKNVQDSRAALI